MNTTEFVSDFANAIARARTFEDLAGLRRELQQTVGILDEERAVIQNTLIQRERDIISFLTQ